MESVGAKFAPNLREGSLKPFEKSRGLGSANILHAQVFPPQNPCIFRAARNHFSRLVDVNGGRSKWGGVLEPTLDIHQHPPTPPSHWTNVGSVFAMYAASGNFFSKFEEK